MEKVLVEIYVPMVGRSYDVFIPQTSKMYEITALAAKVINDLSSGKYKGDSKTILCNAETGDIYDINLSVYEHGIKNGSKLILI